MPSRSDSTSSEQQNVGNVDIDTVEFAEERTGNAPENYGFVALVSTSVLYVIYLIWAFVPDRFLIAAGIEWYPSREWSILVPSYSMVIVLLTYWSYFALSWSSTPPLDSLSTITDEYVFVPQSELGTNPYLRHALPDAVPTIYDMPIGMADITARTGYRPLDLAQVYGDQVEIGEALKKVIPSVQA